MRACGICYDIFTPAFPEQDYCLRHYAHLELKDYIKARLCPKCKKLFAPLRTNQYYCNDPCPRKYRRRLKWYATPDHEI